MKCIDVQLMLPDFVVNKLTNGQVNNIKTHVDSCPKCRQTADELQELMLGLSNIKHEMPSDTYFASILPRVHERIESRGEIFRLPDSVYRFVMPVAMILLIVAIGSNYNRLFPLQASNSNSLTEVTTSTVDLYTILGQEDIAAYDKISSTDKSVIAELLSTNDGTLPITEDDVQMLATSMDQTDFHEFYTRLEQQTSNN